MNKKAYDQICASLPKNCRLLIVSKFRSNEQIMDYYDLGHRAFAENRVQELCAKQSTLPTDIEWHFIGHLQKNKAKYIVPFVSMIHSVEDIELVKILEKEARKCGRTLPVLIQFNLAEESTKSGLAEHDAEAFIEACLNYPHILPQGIMCMGPHTENEEEIRAVFHKADALLKRLQRNYPFMRELSMGMSQDYLIALEENATMIRIGTKLFTE